MSLFEKPLPDAKSRRVVPCEAFQRLLGLCD